MWVTVSYELRIAEKGPAFDKSMEAELKDLLSRQNKQQAWIPEDTVHLRTMSERVEGLAVDWRRLGSLERPAEIAYEESLSRVRV